MINGGSPDDRPFVANASPVLTRFTSSSGHYERAVRLLA